MSISFHICLSKISLSLSSLHMQIFGKSGPKCGFFTQREQRCRWLYVSCNKHMLGCTYSSQMVWNKGDLNLVATEMELSISGLVMQLYTYLERRTSKHFQESFMHFAIPRCHIYMGQTQPCQRAPICCLLFQQANANHAIYPKKQKNALPPAWTV